MAVSSKSIIHYTGDLENLKGIINDGGLQIRYCTENVGFGSSKKSLYVCFPMVCFCDLPLTLAKEHTQKYGAYGIGFSKTWASKNGLNPVLYLEPGSSIASVLVKQINKTTKRDEILPKEELRDDKRNFARMLAFCKQHAGPLVRKGVTVDENYVFYDEREWRYVPNDEVLEKNPLVAYSADKLTEEKERCNTGIKGKLLSFDYSDISYILVNSEKDIPVIIKCIQNKYEDVLPQPTLQQVYARIVTVNQVLSDF